MAKCTMQQHEAVIQLPPPTYALELTEEEAIYITAALGALNARVINGGVVGLYTELFYALRKDAQIRSHVVGENAREYHRDRAKGNRR